MLLLASKNLSSQPFLCNPTPCLHLVSLKDSLRGKQGRSPLFLYFPPATLKCQEKKAHVFSINFTSFFGTFAIFPMYEWKARKGKMGTSFLGASYSWIKIEHALKLLESSRKWKYCIYCETHREGIIGEDWCLGGKEKDHLLSTPLLWHQGPSANNRS